MNICRDTMSSMSYWWKGELKLIDWWRSLRGNMSYAFFSWRDPGPFLAEITRTFRKILTSLSQR